VKSGVVQIATSKTFNALDWLQLGEQSD